MTPMTPYLAIRKLQGKCYFPLRASVLFRLVSINKDVLMCIFVHWFYCPNFDKSFCCGCLLSLAPNAAFRRLIFHCCDWEEALVLKSGHSFTAPTHAYWGDLIRDAIFFLQPTIGRSWCVVLFLSKSHWLQLVDRVAISIDLFGSLRADDSNIFEAWG